MAPLAEQRRRRHRSSSYRHAALTVAALIVASWWLPGAAHATVAEAPVTTATVLAAKTVPGVQLIQTDYSATVSVPEPVINEKATDALFQRLLTQARNGVIDASEASVNEAVVSEFAKAPFTYFAKGKKTFTETGALTGVGTGWVISPDGYIVTAAHVVEGDPEEMKKEFALSTLSGLNSRFVSGLASGNTKFTPDQLKRLSAAMTTWLATYLTVGDLETRVTAQIGVAVGGSKTRKEHPVTVVDVGEPYPGKDVALLKLEGVGHLPTLPLGTDDDVTTGSTLYVAGYPAASTFNSGMSKDSEVQPTVTQGPLTAIKSTEGGMPVFQTQAPASPGNSGGPVLEDAGEVVGILVAGAVGSEGVALAGQEFVVPISVVREVLDKHSVTPATSDTSTAYSQAVDAFYQRHYAKALPLFEQALTLYPGHPYAGEFVTKAKAAVAAGQDETPSAVPSVPSAVVIGGGAAVALAAAGGGALLMRRRRAPRLAAAPAQTWDGPGWPGQGWAGQGWTGQGGPQQPYGQPAFGQPPYGQPQYGVQPQYGQPQYPTPMYGQPPGHGYPPAPPVAPPAQAYPPAAHPSAPQPPPPTQPPSAPPTQSYPPPAPPPG